MLPSRVVIGTFSVAMVVAAAGVASAQNYPNKPIRIITSAAGDGQDLAARIIAQALTVSVGQPVIVDNRVSLIAIETVAKAPADAYTLLVAGNPLWVLPLLRDSVSWDPMRDFSPVILAVTTPGIVVVHPSLPVKSVKELIALAQAKPGQLNYASGPTGSTNHLSVELFKSMAGVNIVRIPYKGSAPALTDLIAGQVQLMFPTAAAVTPHVKSGRLKALAITTARPSVLAPGLPPIAAAGVPGYESGSMYAVFAPGKTPATLVDRLNQDVVRVLNQSDVKEKFFNDGMEVVASSPDQLAATMKSEMARLGKVIKEAGIRAE